jgi:hypothetical protein
MRPGSGVLGKHRGECGQLYTTDSFPLDASYVREIVEGMHWPEMVAGVSTAVRTAAPIEGGLWDPFHLRGDG